MAVATKAAPLARIVPGHRRRARRASVLVIVMITVLFATFALIAFMERAGTDLLADQRAVLDRRLRAEAYSALEVTLAVLESFREVGNGLRSPSEGWGDPLAFAGYAAGEGRTVQVAFEDESGKISLPRTNAQVLFNLFRNWEIPEQDAEVLADALMGWMKKEHVYSTVLDPQYELSDIPYEEPRRSLRSFQELAAIEKVREMFYDDQGRPNELWRRFTGSVSLLDFAQPNINGAKPDTLAAIGQFDPIQQQNVADYLSGQGQYLGQPPGVFQDANEAQRVAGATGDTRAFSTAISALRIIVTVTEGRTSFRVSVVVAPPNGARIVRTNATEQRAQSSATAQANARRQNRPNTSSAGAGAPGQPQRQGANDRNLRYPFTVLEIRENEAPPPPPPVDPVL